jgi:hypothetical protein
VEVVSTQGQDLKSLAPQSEYVWPILLSQGAEGLIPGTVHFRLSYKLKGKAGVAREVFVPLEVKSREADVIEKVAEVVVKTSSTLLNEQRPSKVYLVITNKSNQEIRVNDITPKGPSFIRGDPEVKSFKIGPRDSFTVPIKIAVTDVVTPGKHLLLFDVPIEWGQGEHTQKANLVTSQEFDVGILGESEVLTALGVPSFLLLPGFLMVVTFALLTKIGKSETLQGESLLKAGTNPYLWVIAITLSGVMAFLIYPTFTKWLLKVRRDYLVGYGLYDVILVWLTSIFTGLAAWILVGVIKRFWAWLFTPSADDDAEAILRKLYLQGLGVRLEQIDLTLSGNSSKAFLLQRRKRKREKIWVGPFIEIQWLKEDSALKTSIDECLKPQNENLLARLKLLVQWLKLAWFFRKGRRQHELTVRWKVNSLSEPQLIAVPHNHGTMLLIIAQN